MRTILSKDKTSLQRMDALADGVFSIVATLLVLDIKVPEIPMHHTKAELNASLVHVMPSFIAFAFSFLTVIIYWINHDHISHWLKHYTAKTKYLNLLLLFWICLIPFPTKFISEYPGEQVAVMIYGLELMMVAITAVVMFWYIAFYTNGLNESISLETRKKYFMKVIGGPILYIAAVLLSFISIKISIALYIIIPLLYVFLPKAELGKEE
jgi:uncharacterized membrane protein